MLEKDFKLLIYYILLALSLIILSFNTRLFGLLALIKPDKNSKPLIYYLATISFIPMIFIFFFYQSSSNFNIIQFAPYSLISLIILTGLLIDRFQKNFQKILISIAIISPTIPLSFISIKKYHSLKFHNVNHELIQSLKTLKKYPKGTIYLLDVNASWYTPNYTNNKYAQPNLLYALTGKNTYFFDEEQMKVLSIEYLDRKSKLFEAKKNFCKLSNIISNSNHSYVILDTNINPRCSNMQTKLITKTPNYQIIQI